MSENLTNHNSINESHYADEIDLRQLITALWKRKVLIISLALILAVLTGVFSKFVLTPVYNTKLNIIISIPEIYTTKYGEYKLPLTSNEQYINFIKSNDVVLNTIRDMKYDENVTVEDVKDKISIDELKTNGNTVQNSFHVTVSSESPDESLRLAKTLYANYIEFLNVMLKERAISYFYNDFNIKIETARNVLATKEAELKKNEELLKEIPQTINQKDALKEIQGNVSDYVILENIINPNYTAIENSIIVNKQEINNAQIVIADYSNYMEELLDEKTALTKYRETGDATLIEDGVFDIVDVSIYLPSQPVAPTRKTSPSTLKNTVIGGVIGGMLGVMIAFFVAFWKKEF